MDTMKDCNNCMHHDQARPYPPICTDCLSGITHDNINLKNWAPIVFGVISQEEYRTGILNMPVEEITITAPHDPVKSPAHYMLFPDMESIEAIRMLMSHEEFVGYLKGNVLKYRFRAGRKGGDDAKTLQDIAKSEQYSRFLALAE